MQPASVRYDLCHSKIDKMVDRKVDRDIKNKMENGRVFNAHINKHWSGTMAAFHWLSISMPRHKKELTFRRSECALQFGFSKCKVRAAIFQRQKVKPSRKKANLKIRSGIKVKLICSFQNVELEAWSKISWKARRKKVFNGVARVRDFQASTQMRRKWLV